MQYPDVTMLTFRFPSMRQASFQLETLFVLPTTGDYTHIWQMVGVVRRVPCLR